MTVSETIEFVVLDLEGTADWRRRVQEDHPNDKRNASAAALLERLAAEITSSPDLELVAKLSEIESGLISQTETNKSYDFSFVVEECNEYRRRIGFTEFPSSGKEYLQRLIDIYEEHLRRTKEDWLEYEPPDNPYCIFMDSYSQTRDILADHGGDDGSHLINRMVFTQQLGALEAYLYDTLTIAVMNNKVALNRLLKDDKELVKEKFDLSEDCGDSQFCCSTGP